MVCCGGLELRPAGGSCPHASMKVLKGQFLGLGKGTAGGTNELEFALIHPSLHRLVRIVSDWAVAFQTALRTSLLVASCLHD